MTDEDAVRQLFTGLVEEFGALDAVVNVAGISRPTGFAGGTDEDWTRVLDVHLNGYLTVLRVALPLMAEAGHGRILGVTSGSGWRAADAGAYSCAKRAVAALTWQLGPATPDGVTVNALSPIAATRMVTNALARQAGTGNRTGATAASGGVALAAAPPPEHLGPIGAYLASEDLAWCRGQVLFANGSEVSAVAPPHVLEAVRTTGVPSIAHALETVVPLAFATAEAAQVSSAGSVPRLAAAFDGGAGAGPPARGATRCAVVTEDAAWAAAIGEVLTAHGVTGIDLAPAVTGIAGALEAIDAAAEAGPVDAVVVALGGTGPSAGGDRRRPLAADPRRARRHRRRHPRRRRAGSGRSRTTPGGVDRPVRVVTLTDATTAGGRSRAMSAAQLARAAHGATSARVDAFAIAVESAAESARRAAAELVGHLVGGADVAALSGAELVATAEWIGLRSHPAVAGTVSYGGPELPAWIDAAVRRVVTGDLGAEVVR